MIELAEEGMTMSVVTHEMGFARTVPTRWCSWITARSSRPPPPEEFFHHPKTDRAKLFLSQILEH